MFKAIRRAWSEYLGPATKPNDVEEISDEQIVREYFREPPVSRQMRSAYNMLAAPLLAHLPEALAVKKARQLKASLKPGVAADVALSDWIYANSGRESRVGVISADWKAREEIEWQGIALTKAHGVSLDWRYDVQNDSEWKSWEERNGFPVDIPLKSLAQALAPHHLVLFWFHVDDSAFAFAVQQANINTVQEQCDVLGIKLLG